jgi:hypothetical protein
LYNDFATFLNSILHPSTDTTLDFVPHCHIKIKDVFGPAHDVFVTAAEPFLPGVEQFR